jgi:hypothetical protein
MLVPRLRDQRYESIQHSTKRLVTMSFGRYERSKPQSFPRKRESAPLAFGNRVSGGWIPAFAGMTCV